MKIQIIGYSGSGKSTLAKILSETYQLPLLYMDHVQFYDDWKTREISEQRKIVEQFLKENQSWVIDGNYAHIVPQRFSQCDTIIFLNYPRYYCFWMCLKRYFMYKGKKRESCPCEEKFDWEFISWILKDGRTKEHQQKHHEHLMQCQGKRLTFTSRKQLKKYLRDEGIQDI